MKLLKLADLVIQIALFIGGVIYCLLVTVNYESFLYPYFVLGSWQVLSFLINMTVGTKSMYHGQRNSYGIVLLWALGIGMLTVILSLLFKVPFFLLYLFALLIVSPFWALWYISICYHEYRLAAHRELIHLK